MNKFNYHHELAFGVGSAKHGLHNDGGLPEEANGGWYSNVKLSYSEWYGMSTARMAYNELVEKNPKQVFNLLVSSLNFPWLAIGSGILYCISAVRRVRALYRPNGIQVARYSRWTKAKCASMLALNLLTAASIAKMVHDNYN